jgi:hypothetical protein
MRKTRRPFVPLILIAALAATLLFAATAAAETKIGEGTSPEQAALPGEADLLKGSVEYDSATGRATVALTTRQEQETTPEAGRPKIQYLAALLSVNFTCTREGYEAAAKKAEEEKKQLSLTYPVYELFSANNPFTEPPPGQPLAQAYAALITSQKELESGIAPENFVAGTKVVSGTTATVGATFSKAENQAFNCVEVLAQNSNGGAEPDTLLFPLTTKPEPPPVQAPNPPAPPAPAPAPAPGSFFFAKAKKPLKLEVDKWKTVKVKVTNTGATTTATGSLQLKAPKGVLVKSGRQKLPVLPPGESWTVSYRVELTEKAKKKSTLSLIATAGAVTSKGSLVVKRKD